MISDCFCLTDILFHSYYDEIKEPMDLGTMNRKLDKKQYSTMEQFARDMLLVFDNCRQFNPPGTEPIQHAETLEKVFRKEWGKAMEKKLDPSEKRALQVMLTKLRADDAYVPLLYPLMSISWFPAVLCSSARLWIQSNSKSHITSMLFHGRTPGT